MYSQWSSRSGEFGLLVDREIKIVIFGLHRDPLPSEPANLRLGDRGLSVRRSYCNIHIPSRPQLRLLPQLSEPLRLTCCFFQFFPLSLSIVYISASVECAIFQKKLAYPAQHLLFRSRVQSGLGPQCVRGRARRGFLSDAALCQVLCFERVAAQQNHKVGKDAYMHCRYLHDDD